MARDNWSVALVGQTSIVREGLAQILSGAPFTIGCSVATVDELISRSRLPDGLDLIIVDDPERNAIGEIVEKLVRHFPDSKVALISDAFDFEATVDAIRAGVHGIVIAEISCECLIESLKLIALGERILPSQLADHLPAALGHSPALARLGDDPKLSPREIEIIRCLVQGCPNKTIARRLDISEASVKVHVKAVLRKIPVRNRTQAALWAASRGLAERPANAPLTGDAPLDGASISELA